MSRRPQFIHEGSVYHFIARFVAREWFIQTDHDRAQYLQLLRRGLSGADWTCLAYAIMSNHIHLALIAGTVPLRDWIRGVHSTFAEWMNERRERVGAVFVRGPRMLAVNPRIEGVSRLLSYIHRNPVRAGLAARAVDSAWTSHRAYVGAEVAPSWLDVRRGLGMAGFIDGRTFGDYVDGVAVDRRDLEAVLLHPADRGRPRFESQSLAAAGVRRTVSTAVGPRL